MIHISRIKIKNFKSFKIADIPFPPTYICFAGPNGSGKSNVTDSIKFALGETSLRSLRAKKVKDLIHHGATAAEVTVYFDGEEKYEIKRAIRQDGKILYKLNGKRTTRFAILDALKKYNLDESGRNIIAQGEVQRIVNMTGKERRGIIDSVAGISTFEAKKKEALKELEVVETRIKDAHLVLGERISFLNELEKEKAAALVYRECKTELTDAKATLFKNEIERLEKELIEIYEHDKKFSLQIEENEAEIRKFEEGVTQVETKRHGISQQLQQKQQTAVLIRKIEELKASTASKAQLIEDKEAQLIKINETEKNVHLELTETRESLQKLEKEISKIKKELEMIEKEGNEKDGTFSNSKAQKISDEIEKHKNELHVLREKILVFESEIKSKIEISELKRSELHAIKVSTAQEDEQQEATDKKHKLEQELQALTDGINDCFSRTKEINADIIIIDKKLLECKEDSSLLRVRVTPALANPALKFIAELKEKEEGIYGLVADLIKCDTTYSTAVEAAGGNRLLYVVVEDANTAARIITTLKKEGAGRATFIPLQEIKTVAVKPVNGMQPLIEIIKSSRDVEKAITYVFGDTYLVNSMAEAKKAVGNYRMVTKDGELFERSGIISGGKMQSNILAAMQLKKLDDELINLKAQKDSLIRELFSIREEESHKRSQKASVELELKTIEMSTAHEKEREKEERELVKRRTLIQESIELLEKEKEEIKNKKEETAKLLVIRNKKIEELTQVFEQTISQEKELNEVEQQKRTERAAHLSSLYATYEGKLQEHHLQKNTETEKIERIDSFEKEKTDSKIKITEFKKQLAHDQVELKKVEQEVAQHSKEIEKLFELMKKYEEELQTYGKLIGEKRTAYDKINRDRNQLIIKKATSETRVQDLKAEYVHYPQFKELQLTKEQLMELIKKSEQKIQELGDVNMAAIELYDKKYAEIGEIKGKLEKLSEERTAVFGMIGEIEERKKEAFFETFYAVSDNFRKMFTHIAIGEGILYLDMPNDPFESGLHIKLKRGGKEHTLDSLSGGENSLVALMFIFALQFFKPAPFYILDEVDAALDKENSKNLSKLITSMARDTQFMMVSHNDVVMSSAAMVLGVTKVDSVSKIVGVNLEAMERTVA